MQFGTCWALCPLCQLLGSFSSTFCHAGRIILPFGTCWAVCSLCELLGSSSSSFGLLGRLCSRLGLAGRFMLHLLTCRAGYHPVWDLLGSLSALRSSRQPFQFWTSWSDYSHVMEQPGGDYPPPVDYPGRLLCSLELPGQFVHFASC